MIARPYSPELFRTGPPAGPHDLLQVLRGKMSKKEAVKKLDVEEKRREDNKAPKHDSKWLFCMRLPCRMCSDATDVDSFKPLEAFVPSKAPNLYSTAEHFAEIWLSSIALGADLACWSCRHKLGHLISEHQCNQHFGHRLICCEDCWKIKLASDFSKDMQDKWRITSLSSRISCKLCTGEQATRGRHAVDKTVLYTCSGAGCSTDEQQQAWPQSHFL